MAKAIAKTIAISNIKRCRGGIITQQGRAKTRPLSTPLAVQFATAVQREEGGDSYHPSMNRNGRECATTRVSSCLRALSCTILPGRSFTSPFGCLSLPREPRLFFLRLMLLLSMFFSSQNASPTGGKLLGVKVERGLVLLEGAGTQRRRQPKTLLRRPRWRPPGRGTVTTPPGRSRARNGRRRKLRPRRRRRSRQRQRRRQWRW